MSNHNHIRNELEKIEIPDEIHSRARLGVKKAKVENNDKRPAAPEENKRSTERSPMRKKSLYKRLSIIAAALLLIASTLTFTPVIAAIQEVYDKLFSSNHIDDSGVRNAVLSGDGQILDQSYTDERHDITVHFERLLTDDKETKLLLTYQSKTTDLKDYYIDLFEGASSINLMVGNEKRKLKNVGWGSRYYDKKENKVATALSFESLKDYEGKDIRLEIDQLTIWNDNGQDSVDTIWPVEFKIKPAAVSERKTVRLNQTFTYKRETYTVNKVEFSKLETRVVVSGSDTGTLEDVNGKEYRVMSKLERQYLNARKISKEYGYIVNEKKSGVFIKSKGEKVEPIFSKGEVEGENGQYIMTFAPVENQEDCVLEVGDAVVVPLNKSGKVIQKTVDDEQSEIEELLAESGYTLEPLTKEEKKKVDQYLETFPKELSIKRIAIGKLKGHEKSKILDISISERSGVISSSEAQDLEKANKIREKNGFSFIPIYLEPR
ncbi:DUF4179 domain-containing protein [Rossellomorea oryzaecorticis]|uniref:DUF4179 domain-containing protein n=1 Tax=Rossellomorea oryzaecorticis TaxID=1396505 RepID=A0ABW8VPC2_9BACI|nr:DUF4179 domain-containing protein [[Bacillus] enclensis]MBH9966171.1 DUF4179 domain-containing protein [[Bacillus] enclensis]